MPKRKPSQRRKPETTPQPPRDRLAEIRAEIQSLVRAGTVPPADSNILVTTGQRSLAGETVLAELP